jgi:hypothetical protein
VQRLVATFAAMRYHRAAAVSAGAPKAASKGAGFACRNLHTVTAINPAMLPAQGDVLDRPVS